jgi:hypothetical protein
MVIVEAWSHGKPVLMTPACNLPEGLESRAAIQIAYDRDEIVPRVQPLFTMSPVERNELGKQGLHLISEEFSWERICAQMMAVSDWILPGGALPATVCCARATAGLSRTTRSHRLTGRTGTMRETNASARFSPHVGT